MSGPDAVASVAPTLRVADEGLPAGCVLPLQFFSRPVAEVAPELIGKILWRQGVGGGRLTEVEAYLPQDDPACHAWRGRTARNAAMFGPPGSIYVFTSYGLHKLLNLVCDLEAVGAAVLIRSFEPMGDEARLRSNRGLELPAATVAASAAAYVAPDVENVSSLTTRGASRTTLPTEPGPLLSCGPGRVGQALGIERDLNGSLLGEGSGLYVIDDGERPLVERTTRVGVSRGESLPLRYYLAGSRYVSAIPRT